MFLTNVFFDFAQTNYSYVDEQVLREKLSDIYSKPMALVTTDSPWLCTLFMLFAIGSQFAHLSSRVRQEDVGDHSEPVENLDDNIALRFYHAATSLIPDVITIASVGSVQAFLLLGVYTLPIDATGLSFSYLGAAIRIAVRNGMHRACHSITDARTSEVRNRIWWTAFTLERYVESETIVIILIRPRRICVLHGLPVSVSRRDVDAEQPSDVPSLRPEQRIDTLPNILAMIRLTSLLEEARDAIRKLKTLLREDRKATITLIARVRQNLKVYWEGLPSNIYCKDLAPARPLFRFNTHLALTYNLVHIFIGRNFILSSQGDSAHTSGSVSPVPEWTALRMSLVSTCVQSAINIISLCQTLHDEVGLSRASYTEFTSCHAALLVMLAQRIQDENANLRKVSKQGMLLLKHMSLGSYQDDSETFNIEAMELAIQRLDERIGHVDNPIPASSERSSSAYNEFRKWASLWKSGTPIDAGSSNHNAINMGSPSANNNAVLTPILPIQDLGWDAYLPISPFNFEYGLDFDADIAM